MSLRFLGPLTSILTLLVLIPACGETPDAEPASKARVQIAMVLDTGKEDDKSFNAHALKGAREGAAKHGFELSFTSSASEMEYESHLENVASKKPGLIITVGFRMGDATARAARRHPELKFAIIDVAFVPGAGCSENVKDCYSKEGGLTNVTSLLFAEDQVAYLAGVLAACMSRSGVIASVAGPEILPVQRFVIGYENGAKSINPKIRVFNTYLPGFNDPELGRLKTTEFIENGADVIFGVGGNSGSGALIQAKESGAMAIGVDGDQYFTVPEAREVLLTSASKKIDIATAKLIDDFASGKLASGVRMATLENQGVALAPFHDWDNKIGDDCRAQLDKARQNLIANPKLTGAMSAGGGTP